MATRIFSNGGDPIEASNFTGSLLQAALNLEIAAVTGRGSVHGGEEEEDDKKRLARLEEVMGRIDQLDKEAVTRRAVEGLSAAGLHTVSPLHVVLL